MPLYYLWAYDKIYLIIVCGSHERPREHGHSLVIAIKLLSDKLDDSMFTSHEYL